VTGIQVHDDVGKVEVLDGVGDTIPVTGGAVLASILVRVGNKVGKRVRLNNEREGRIGVGLENFDDGFMCVTRSISTRVSFSSIAPR
jgi:hypothetical protein